ncbi:GNAT family N-acetyltransferase [Nakamurella sp. YIM 132087]|uniref:GNAT family N-acetyltransferase n=1 Tax=Nakamurella alba TaxID=2665158 RepID=A0A7K1FH69_9ACTN|nr:GNAT family N-acetyltransferase [Nakamurella alba]MTD12809.1 GNAT family N-acetyltransferase [Nakamurella alba]
MDPIPAGHARGVDIEWRGAFTSDEANRLHAEAFGARLYSSEEWDWERQVAAHSLGWVTARSEGRLVGFVNVLWDGLVHAWIQDVMVDSASRRLGIGRALVDAAAHGARESRCLYLHVDFDDALRPFYIDSCGFRPTSAGLLEL